METEFFELAKERLSGILEEEIMPEPYGTYFRKVASFLSELTRLYDEIGQGKTDGYSRQQWEEVNKLLYADIRPQSYAQSYANPTYAVETLGEQFGSFLSFIYMLQRSLIGDVFEQRMERFVRHIQYFLLLYSSFVTSFEEGKKEPDFENIREDLTSFVFSSYEQEMEYAVTSMIDPDQDFAYRIIMESDLSDPVYLYRFGEYISENEIKTAEHLSALPAETLQLMADTYTEGYRIGFEKTGKDLSIKKSVQIYYPLGFERMIKLAIANFEKMGLRPVIRRNRTDAYVARYGNVTGFCSTSPNRQCEFDHKEDASFFWDKSMAVRRLECIEQTYKQNKEKAKGVAGPAVIETFGEIPFSPKNEKHASALSKTQREITAWFYSQQSDITNRYIPGEERSFTIIAFPVPEIGDRYEAIMQDTIKLNTLDYRRYETVQQIMIDALDTCEKVYIKGMNKNETDLTVYLHTLADPQKETIFENCVADVNIPVGEVFTSPKLAGTNGKLHVTRVFLEGLEYTDLWFTFRDGKVADYGCANFEDPAKGRDLIESEILNHHKTLPIGEFAIGTNTTAYHMARAYGIEDRLPILIAEKTGPHLALGDTCYSHEEDNTVYNPDGKEIVAKDNECSLLRKSEDEETKLSAYFQCHTDITIPFDELGLLCGIRPDGREVKILENGRFVLEGCEMLNEQIEAWESEKAK